MYTRPTRRRASSGLAGVHARQMPAEHHSGSVGEFLRRHEREAKQAALGSRSNREEFARKLLSRAGDERNVKLAIEHCCSRGQAAGPNGLRPSDLATHDQWALARELGTMIKEGQYRPSTPRTILIEKGSGRGQRPIRIQDFEDRCVERALLQVIRPVTGTQYLDRSMGFRSPGYSREYALATAEHGALTHSRWLWIGADLENAFENVPTGRLAQTLRRMIPNEEICDFIGQIAFNESGRGIRQGGPLSPELLNVYLHWVLDRKWDHNHPDTTLLRYADDLLILTNPEEAPQLYEALKQHTVAMGMPLKGTASTSLHDLATGQPIDWLGYTVQRDETGVSISIGQRSWDKLEEHLRLAWEEPIPPLSAIETIRGWISQQGAAYKVDAMAETYRGISQLASAQGFDEIPEPPEIACLWSRAYDRDWVQARQEVSDRLLVASMSAGGSASQHCETAAVNCCGGVASATRTMANSAPRRREVFIYCDGSCLSPHGVGAWAFLSIDAETGYALSNGGADPQTTNNRMELMAVIQGLASLPESSCVRLYVDSEYVARGITERLRHWIDRGWRTTGRRRRLVANIDLWQRLNDELQRHEVYCQWVLAHSGHPENEFVDQLARRIASHYQDQRSVVPSMVIPVA